MNELLLLLKGVLLATNTALKSQLQIHGDGRTANWELQNCPYKNPLDLYSVYDQKTKPACVELQHYSIMQNTVETPGTGRTSKLHSPPTH